MDVWERVRRGFAMPDLENDLVRNREQWYASRPDYLQRMTSAAARMQALIIDLLNYSRVNTRGQPLQPWRYRDFGSLVSLGEFSTVGNMMGGLIGKSLMIEGYFAKLMYLSLYKLHELAIHGILKTALFTLSRMITKQTNPTVKLH